MSRDPCGSGLRYSQGSDRGGRTYVRPDRASRESHRDRLSERVGGDGGSGIGGEAALQAALLMDASRRDVILLEAFVPNAPEVKELLDRVASRELDP